MCASISAPANSFFGMHADVMQNSANGKKSKLKCCCDKPAINIVYSPLSPLGSIFGWFFFCHSHSFLWIVSLERPTNIGSLVLSKSIVNQNRISNKTTNFAHVHNRFPLISVFLFSHSVLFFMRTKNWNREDLENAMNLIWRNHKAVANQRDFRWHFSVVICFCILLCAHNFDSIDFENKQNERRTKMGEKKTRAKPKIIKANEFSICVGVFS